MPAAIDTMCWYGEMPWHKEGDQIDYRPDNWDEMRKLAGLDWNPVRQISLVPLLDDKGEPRRDADGNYIGKPSTKFETIVRSDNHDVELSSVKGTYQLIDHDQMGEVMEKMRAALKLQGIHSAYETAGSVHEGGKVWALAIMGQDDGYFEIPGDFSRYRRYLAALNDHTGYGAFKVVNTNVRVVCANTFHMADVTAEAEGKAFTFRHTKNWAETIEDAVKAVTRAAVHAEQFVETATEAGKARLTDEQWEYLVREFAVERTFRNVKGIKSRDEVEATAMSKPSVAQSLANAKSAFDQLAKRETNAELDQTALKFWNIAVEMMDHHRDAKSTDTYITRNLIEPEYLKRFALDIAMTAGAR